MIIQQKKGKLDSVIINNHSIDYIELEWHETGKRILHKRTQSGIAVSLKFLQENPALTEGDILYEDDNRIIAVTILSCEVIAIKPASLFEMASVCYEIGNKHLPLFYENDELLVPFEKPLFRLLTAQGYVVRQDKLKLLHPLKTTVSPHAHSGSSLFSKIMQLTNSAE